MDRQGYTSPFSCPLFLSLLFSPSSCPSSPFSHPGIQDTRVSSIVCFTILVLPVLLDEEYWSFQLKHTILEAPIFFIQQYW
jgi:hypothetical protein